MVQQHEKQYIHPLLINPIQCGILPVKLKFTSVQSVCTRHMLRTYLLAICTAVNFIPNVYNTADPKIMLTSMEIHQFRPAENLAHESRDAFISENGRKSVAHHLHVVVVAICLRAKLMAISEYYLHCITSSP